MRSILLLLSIFLSSEALSSSYFAGVSGGFHWHQYDFNSDHKESVYGGEIGVENISLRLSASSMYTKSDYKVTSQSSYSDRLSETEIYDSNLISTLWVMPSFSLGKTTLYGGVGAGLVYDTVKIPGRSTRSGFESDFGLRGGVEYRIKNMSVSADYQHHSWETDTNREISDYEVRQNRVFYQAIIKYHF